MSKINVNIAIADSALDRMDEIVVALEALGVTVTRRLESIGIVTGTVDGDLLQQLRGLAGIVDVEAMRDVHTQP